MSHIYYIMGEYIGKYLESSQCICQPNHCKRTMAEMVDKLEGIVCDACRTPRKTAFSKNSLHNNTINDPSKHRIWGFALYINIPPDIDFYKVIAAPTSIHKKQHTCLFTSHTNKQEI